MTTGGERGSLGESPSRRRPTLHDVARAAGVSHQTVSRVINDGPNVSEPMRARVIDAVRSTRYRRNPAARALKTAVHGTIGVLIPAGGEPSFEVKVRAVEAAARANGYAVLVSSADPTSTSSLRAGLVRSLSQPIDGIITIIAHRNFTELPDARNFPIPHLMLMSDAIIDPPGLPDTGDAGQLGARLVARHLIDLGHRRIAHLAGPDAWVSAQSRADGFRAELAQRNLPALVAGPGDWTAESGYLIGQKLLREHPDITAVCASNDQMAIGLLHAAHRAGRDVPRGLSVVGFDDLPEAAYLSPPLTTLRKNETGLADRAVAVLLDRIRTDADGAGSNRLLLTVEPQLVIRESTAPPAD